MVVIEDKEPFLVHPSSHAKTKRNSFS